MKIYEIQQRNQGKYEEKQHREELIKLQEDQERERLRKERELKQKYLDRQKKMELDGKRQVYHDLRKQRAFAVKYKSKVRMQVVKENMVKRDMVREEEKRIHDKLKQREDEKKKRNQLHYSMRIEDQKKVISQVDTEISAMESEEREILERLKNSQQQEQDAYRDLENAIKTSVDKTEWRKKQMNQRQRLPIQKPTRSNKARSTNGSIYDSSLH